MNHADNDPDRPQCAPCYGTETVNHADYELRRVRPQRDDLLSALRTITDHAQERYPHFESERGQRDIADALAAIARATGAHQPICAPRVSTDTPPGTAGRAAALCVGAHKAEGGDHV